MKPYSVYIMTNVHHTVIYTGVTNNLRSRSGDHKSGKNKKSFTARYNVTKLVYYEEYDWILAAIKREKYIKGKTRQWKIDLINSKNPNWDELTPPW
jgi:putative endonuclease